MVPSQIKGLRGDVACYVAQTIPQIDATYKTQIGEINHLWMETRLYWKAAPYEGTGLIETAKRTLNGYINYVKKQMK